MIGREIGLVWENWLRWAPGGVGFRLRRSYYRRRLRACGAGLSIAAGCVVRGARNIQIGDEVRFGLWNCLYSGLDEGDAYIKIGDSCSFNSNVMINADIGGRIELGNGVLVGPNVILRASNHEFRSREKPIREQGHHSGTILVGDDVWIAGNCCILPDVEIGVGAVIGAGSVVTKDVEPYSIVAGVPARKIDERQ